MTTHDYPSEANSPAQLDPTTASTERMVDDPSWQRQADEFVANRSERVDDGASHAQEESSTETSLFAEADREELRRGWDSVQAGFVDDPKRCVEQADGLVSDAVERLSNSFAEARSRLEQQWGRGEQASTEDLRVALKRYREFFDRLLAV
jgi:hypothetical protein